MGVVVAAVMTVSVGVDIGQKRDPSAIAVVEAERARGPEEELAGRTVYRARFVERLALGTPYPDVAKRVAAVARGAAKRAGVPARVYLDATGVGQPVVDLLFAEADVGIVPVYFTHGDRLTAGEHGWSLGKAYLVARLQVLLQDRRLRLPEGLAEGPALVEELLDYEIRVSENANDQYGAFKVGTHDDLVTALGLAVLAEPADEWRVYGD